MGAFQRRDLHGEGNTTGGRGGSTSIWTTRLDEPFTPNNDSENAGEGDVASVKEEKLPSISSEPHLP